MQPDHIDPRLAADLAKPQGDKLATDLSKEAIAARNRQRRLQAAANWAKAMKRTFKGIRGCPTNREYVRIAIQRDPVLSKELEDG